MEQEKDSIEEFWQVSNHFLSSLSLCYCWHLLFFNLPFFFSDLQKLRTQEILNMLSCLTKNGSFNQHKLRELLLREGMVIPIVQGSDVEHLECHRQLNHLFLPYFYLPLWECQI